MKRETVSIIVPVYNTDKYLSECVYSILNQTYENIEIILVNDASADGSEEICKKYQKKDKRIKYLKVNNHNAALTRRDGIRKSTGQLVCFCDSDDIISPKYVEIMYDALTKSNVDVATGKLRTFNDGDNVGILNTKNPKVAIKHDLIKLFADSYHVDLAGKSSVVMQSINAKLFKKKLFENIDYTVVKTNVFEDNFIMPQIYKNVENDKIAIIDETLYFYRLRASSIMQSTSSGEGIPYGNKEISYPELFVIAMQYISKLYGHRKDIQDLIYKIEAEEFYDHSVGFFGQQKYINDLKQVIVDQDRQSKDKEKEFDKAITEKDSQIQNMINSRTYQIGLIFTAPYHALRRLVK